MKTLVTGGAGFIGSHLAGALMAAGHDVVVLDNLSRGTKQNVPAKARFVKGDIRNEDDVAKAVRGCSFVFHLAAQTEVRFEDPEKDFQVNFSGAKNVFDAARSVGAKVIFASSAAVYGDGKLPLREAGEKKPISDYGRNKLKAEKLLGDGAFIVRIFNVYGPSGHGVINRFCEKLKKNDELEIYGTGMQTRDYIYVSDVVSALLLGLRHGGTYNAGTQSEISLIQLLDVLRAATRQQPRTKFLPEKERDIKRSKADISKIKELNWSPAVKISDGIAKTYESA